HGKVGARKKDERGLPSITIRRVVRTAQTYVLVLDERGKCAGVFRDELDSGKPDLAAIAEAEAAGVDYLRDTAFVLHFERASTRLCRRCSHKDGDRESCCDKPAHRHYVILRCACGL